MLAGPIVRRTEAGAFRIWLATAEEVTARAEVYDPSIARETFELGPGSPLAAAEGLARSLLGKAEGADVERRRLGQALYVHLLTARPTSGRFPTDAVLAYDVQLDGMNLDELGLTDALAYAPFRFPTVTIASSLRRVLHGSCRKLHGGGEDALHNADELIAGSVASPSERPAALMLTGDQIYADDVHDRVYTAMVVLAQRLSPFENLPGLPLHEQIPPGGRGRFLGAVLSSDHRDNHALAFGEYAALYLLAWNPDLHALGIESAAALMGEREHTAIAAARRAMANTPTYMLFDDHDVTDDWYLNEAWKGRALGNPLGRRVIANALAAYWAFQGWGNAPEHFSTEMKDTVERHVSAPAEDTAGDFERALLEHQTWSFVTPTEPRVLFLDTRTRRGRSESLVRGVELVEPDAYVEVAAQLHVAGHRKGEPLVVVSPTPVLGHPLHEAVQRIAGHAERPHAADTESWTAHHGSRPRLAELLGRGLGLDRCVVLSGDVHYGFHALGEFEEAGQRLVIAQLTSSSLRNADDLTRGLDRKELAAPTAPVFEVGWRRRPAATAQVLALASQATMAGDDLGATARLLEELVRQQRTDEPLVLPAALAELLPLPPHDWELRWRFVPVGSAFGERQTVVGETNLGDVLLRLRDGRATSTLFTRRGGRRGSGIATATLRLQGAGSAYRRGATRSRAAKPTPGDDKREELALHLIQWYLASRNEAWGKPILPFADFRLERLPRQVLPGGRGDYIKTQVHSITFERAGTSVAQLGTILTRRFEALLPPDQAQIIVNPVLPLALGSEIRWQVALGALQPAAQAAIEKLAEELGKLPLDEETERLVRQEINRAVANRDPTRRRFDVRVVHLETTGDRFGFQVATLANHPYGGARAWEIRRYLPSLPDLYTFTTVEFNTYAWLPDALVEIGNDAAQTRLLWSHMLGRFAVEVGGRVTAAADPALVPLVDPGDLLLQTATELLVPETLARSALARWVRRAFPRMDAIVSAVFGAA